MWKIETSGSLAQRWPTTNIWEEDEGEEEEEDIKNNYCGLLLFSALAKIFSNVRI